MKKLTDMMNGNKKTEMEKNQEEIGLVNASINELNAKKADFDTIRKGLELELKLGADASLEKRFKKLSKAIEDADKELTELQQRATELNQAIAEENARQKKAKIEEAGKAHEERVYKSHKLTLLNNELDRLSNWLYGRTGNPIYADELRKLAGLKYGERFDRQEHLPYWEAEAKAGEVGRERAQKEFEKLMKQVNEFLEKN